MWYRARGFHLSALLLMSVVLAPLAARAESIDQLYEKAKAEGGADDLYRRRPIGG
jgi:hypothetical protein